MCVTVDVTDPEAVGEAVSRLTAPVDILVCSAGITGCNDKTTNYPVDEWKRVIDVNLTGNKKTTSVK